MDEAQLKNDYEKYSNFYQSLQKEIFNFIEKLKSEHDKAIHIAVINERPNKEIKTINSILKNLKDKRYKKHKTIFDIKDIAGTRITCHCEDDIENLAILLQGELKQKYSNVERKNIGGRGSEYPYRAVHITFSKTAQYGKSNINIFCEIQKPPPIFASATLRQTSDMPKRWTKVQTRPLRQSKGLRTPLSVSKLMQYIKGRSGRKLMC